MRLENEARTTRIVDFPRSRFALYHAFYDRQGEPRLLLNLVEEGWTVLRIQEWLPTMQSHSAIAGYWDAESGSEPSGVLPVHPVTRML